jgi:DNA gyrase subunit A
MLVTDNGRLIRMPVDQVRITGRSSMGVTLLRLNEREKVTSCFTVVEEQGVDEVAGDEPGLDEAGPADA